MDALLTPDHSSILLGPMPKDLKLRQKLARLHAQGLRGEAMEKAMGLSRQRVSQLRAELGLVHMSARPARWKAICGLIRDGLKGQEMANHFGVSLPTLYRDIREMKLSAALRDRFHANARPSPTARRKAIPELIRSGLSGQQMADHLGVHVVTIYNDVRELKLTAALRRQYRANGSAAMVCARTASQLAKRRQQAKRA